MIDENSPHEWDGPTGFDPFTPHVRIVSLGGIKVHEGAWTCMETLLALLKRSAESVTAEGTLVQEDSRFYAQFNGLRATFETSLVGMRSSWLGLLWVDARHDKEWIRLSTQHALDELATWQSVRERQGETSPPEVIIWIEEHDQENERSKMSSMVQQALNRIKRFCQHIRVSVLSDMFSHISSGPEADQCHSIWERLTYELSTDAILRRAEETQDHSTLVEYIDDMVLLPAGTFYQGGPQISSSAERPRHQVKISNSFWVGQTAVTHRLWETVMGDGKGRDSGLEPKAEVSWFEALHFCNRLSEQSQLEPVYKIEDHQLPRVIYKTSSSGFRLLTESEWEYACLGGQRTSLTAPPFSPIPAWTQQRSQLKVHPVAQLFPNQWGLYDCLGNVAEWCQDEYHAHAYQERRRLTSDPCEYHSDGGERVIRGGAFDSVEYLVTPSRRDACRPQKRWSSIGFRVARSHQSK